MKHISGDFLYSLCFGLILGVAGYLFSGGDSTITIICFIVGVFIQDSEKLKEIIRKKDIEIEILKYETYDDPEIERIKKLAVDMLQEAQNEGE